MAISYIGSQHGVATSTGFDTSGANLLLAVVVGDGGYSFSDNKSNTWTALTERIGAAGQRLRFHYCVGTINTGSGHTITSTVGYHRVILGAFSGVDAIGGETWTDDGGFSLEAINAGSLTPSSDGALLVGVCAYGNTTSAFAMDGTTGYTLAQSQTGVSGTSYGGGYAYKIQGTAAAINPEFQWTGSVRTSAAHVWFSAAAGGGSSNGAARHYYAQL